MHSLVSSNRSSLWPSLNSLRICNDNMAFVRGFALRALEALREFSR